MNRKARRWLVFALAAALVALLPVVAWSSGETEVKQMTFGTGNIGGAYVPIGTGICEIVNKRVSSVKLTPESTGGSQENVRLVGTHQVDLALTNADIAYFAVNGLNQFEGKAQDLLALGSLHTSVFQIVTLPNLPIDTIADLKGRTVSVGGAGSGSDHAITIMLTEHGMSRADIVASNLGHSQGIEALKDGRVQAVSVLAGSPVAALLELRNSTKFKVVKAAPGVLDKIAAEMPYYIKIRVPASVYNLDEDYETLAVPNVIIVHPSLEEELGYQMAKALYDNIAELGDYHNAAKKIVLADTGKTSIPLHPGAKRYFQEKGLLPK